MPVDLSFNVDRSRAALTFSQPPGNLLTLDVVGQLRAAAADLGDERRLKLVTIAGAGDDFSFGASIPEHLPETIDRVLADTHALLLELIDLPAPTAAVVRGRCLGGGFELALACDFILAEPGASFGLPEIALGVFPPAACVLLSARVGASVAAWAALTGEVRSTEDWQRVGLVRALDEPVDDWFTRTFAPRSAESLRHAVRAVRYSVRETFQRDLPVLEQLYLKDLMRSSDAVEGLRAFMEKRAPRWKDQ